MTKELKNLNLLYIEDDITTQNNYLQSFQIIFHTVFTAINYKEALSLFKNKKVDIVLVDIELKSTQNGFDIANSIRTLDFNVPIVFLTGHDETELVLQAINSNMDGYIIKPLNLKKFINITENVLKKIQSKEFIQFKDFYYNCNTLELFSNEGKYITLGKKENQLLQVFLENNDIILSRETLEHKIWDEPLTSETTLKNLISSLRKKIGKETIVNISKIGWRIKFD